MIGRVLRSTHLDGPAKSAGQLTAVVPCRLAVVLALAVGAGCGSDPTCDVALLATRRIGGVAAIDCGNVVAEGEVHPELEEARDCVEGALDASSPFLVIWTYHGFET